MGVCRVEVLAGGDCGKPGLTLSPPQSTHHVLLGEINAPGLNVYPLESLLLLPIRSTGYQQRQR